MLKLKKYPRRSPFWTVRGTVKGQLIFESTGTADKHQAEEYRRKREAELYESIALGAQKPTTFADAVIAYVNAGGEARFLKPILDHFQDTPVADIRQTDVDACAAKLYPNAKNSTINRQCINQIITVIKHAADTEMPGAVRRKIRRRREAKVAVSPASDDHLDKLLPHLPEGLRALILLMTYTGLRTGEALRVTADDIRDGYAHVGMTKNGEPRSVPLPEGWTYPTGGFGYNTTQGVGKALRKAHEAAELPYRDGHELGRHAFAARFLKAGGNIKRLKEAGGWKKLQVVDEAYGHLELSDVHDFMRNLSRTRAKSVQSKDGKKISG